MEEQIERWRGIKKKIYGRRAHESDAAVDMGLELQLRMKQVR